MKEKIKLILKHKYFKYLILLLIGLFIVWQSCAVFIDIYNFKQLEKAKPYLETIDKNTKKFYNIKEFNERYNVGIKSIKNCYDISNYNGKEKYIFGFKLESLIYIYIYGTKYYSYPKYDAPYRNWCESGIGCYDKNKEIFERVISNPCKEDKE